MSCDVTHTGDLNKVFCTPIESISSDKIECDIVYFTDWLNRLAELSNKNCQVNAEVVDKVNELNQRMECVEARLDAIDQDLTEIWNKINNHEERIKFLEEQLGGVNSIINEVNVRVDWIYNRLPGATGVIPDDWRFAMGNINLTSANGGTPSMLCGIYTSMQLEDNDVYAN